MLSWVHRHDRLPDLTAREVLADVGRRALLPSVVLALANVLLGWLIMGPLGGFPAEGVVNAQLQAGRTPALDTVARTASLLGSTPFAIGTALLGSDTALGVVNGVVCGALGWNALRGGGSRSRR